MFPRRVIVGVLLAAGASRRYGSPKLVQPLPDGTPVAIAAALPLRMAVDHVLAVIRPGDSTLAGLFEHHGVATLPCPEAAAGMGHSIACGIKASAKADGWVVALADMPFIQPSTVQGVAALLREGVPLAAPVYQGRRGHPVAFSRDLGPRLMALEGDGGARAVVAEYHADLCAYPCDDPGIHRDIDRAADLANGQNPHPPAANVPASHAQTDSSPAWRSTGSN